MLATIFLLLGGSLGALFNGYAIRKSLFRLRTILQANTEPDNEKVNAASTKMFIHLAIAEAVPVLLIALGLVNLFSDPSPHILYKPLVFPILVLCWIFGIYNGSFIKGNFSNENAKARFTSFRIISRALISPLPIISFAMFLLF